MIAEALVNTADCYHDIMTVIMTSHLLMELRFSRVYYKYKLL